MIMSILIAHKLVCMLGSIANDMNIVKSNNRMIRNQEVSKISNKYSFHPYFESITRNMNLKQILLCCCDNCCDVDQTCVTKCINNNNKNANSMNNNEIVNVFNINKYKNDNKKTLVKNLSNTTSRDCGKIKIDIKRDIKKCFTN